MTKFELLEKNIINLLGLESLPLEEKQVIIGKATDLVEQRVLLRLFQMLKKEDERELKKIQNEDQKIIWEFLFTRFSNFEDILEEETIKVKQELFKTAQDLKQA